MIRIILFAVLFFANSLSLFAQGTVTIEQARALERQFKTEEALGVFVVLSEQTPKDIGLMVRIAETHIMLSNELEKIEQKKPHLEKAKKYADLAYAIDTNNADALYAKALVLGQWITLVSIKDKAKMTKEIKDYADKALAKNPTHVKANYTLAKWHQEVASLNPAAKTALRMFFGGLPPASLDDALLLHAKTQKLDPSFFANNYDFAKLLIASGRSDKAIELLQYQLKLVPKTREDRNIKSASKILLETLI